MATSFEQLQNLFRPRYELRREIGGGSMAAVYLAEDSRHGRAVAIKVLRPEYTATIAAERFLREIEIAARLQHPHIVPLLDSGSAAGTLYLVMPFIEGESLRGRLVREGRLTAGEVIRIVADVADALAHAHQKGIVHRDIKPDNIMLAGRHALVTDFGVAKAVSAAALAPRDLTIGVALGTPAYMAPEQATADPNLDHRVDLYALGVVAYELLAGHPPFEGPNPQAVLTAHVLDAPVAIEQVRPDVTPPLAALVMRALAKHPDERWRSADELLAQLEPLATPSGGTTPAGVQSVRPSRLSLPWLAGLLVLAAGLFGAFLLTRRAPPPLPEAAQHQLTFTGRVESAAISPDGQLLAFVADSAGGQVLQVQDVRGGAAILLARGSRLEAPTWSGDGSEVRYFTFDRDLRPTLVGVPRLGGPARTLVPYYPAALSPDGSRLAALPQGGTRLIVTSVATGESVSVEAPPGLWFSGPAWSPDGRGLAFVGVEHSGRNYEVIVATPPEYRPRVVARDSARLGAPVWGDMGRSLYYARATGHLADLVRMPLTAAADPAGEPRVIVSGLATGTSTLDQPFLDPVSITADGTRLVYTQRQEWSNLLAVPLGTRARRLPARMLTAGSAQYAAARFSPDGREFAFIRSETDGLSLQVMKVGGSASREIGRLVNASSLAWSHDGSRLVVSASEAHSGLGLRIFHVAGGPTQTLFNGAVGGMAEWLSDSEIVVPGLGNRTLQVVVPASGSLRPLPGADTVGWMLFPRMSPDRSRLAFVWNPGGGHAGVYLLRLGDPAARLVHAGYVLPVGWSDSGQVLYLAPPLLSGDSIRVLAQPAGGGPASEVLTLAPGAEVVDIAPDGATALVNQVEGRSDAWLIRLPAAVP